MAQAPLKRLAIARGRTLIQSVAAVMLSRGKALRVNSVQPSVTLYSLRHTGALRVFEKTGSLQKLQQVMGHSDMKVSLTYLRGLEVKQLDVEDLPEL